MGFREGEGVSQNDRGVSERLRVSEESRGFHRKRGFKNEVGLQKGLRGVRGV